MILSACADGQLNPCVISVATSVLRALLLKKTSIKSLWVLSQWCPGDTLKCLISADFWLKALTSRSKFCCLTPRPTGWFLSTSSVTPLKLSLTPSTTRSISLCQTSLLYYNLYLNVMADFYPLQISMDLCWLNVSTVSFLFMHCGWTGHAVCGSQFTQCRAGLGITHVWIMTTCMHVPICVSLCGGYNVCVEGLHFSAPCSILVCLWFLQCLIAFCLKKAWVWTWHLECTSITMQPPCMHVCQCLH